MREGSPTEELRADHDHALAEIERIEVAVAHVAASAACQAELRVQIRTRIEQLRGDLSLHFRKEEEALFPEVREMIAEGAPRGDIIGAFFAEAADDDMSAHHLLRQRLQEMIVLIETAEETGAQDCQWAEGLKPLASAAGDLLTRHADKERDVIFPMIERMLTPEQLAAAGERMRRLTTGLAWSSS